MKKPSIGRVVHVTLGGSCRPALVAHVWSDTTVNVGGFDQNGLPFARTSVAAGDTEGTWHWPEYVPDEAGTPVPAASMAAHDKEATKRHG